MFTQTLLNVAVLVYFSVSSGHGVGFGLHASTKSAVSAEENVVIVDQAFCDKCVVHSDLPSPLPKYPIASFLNIDSSISNFEAAREFRGTHRFIAIQRPASFIPPHDESLPEQFDALLSKASPSVVNPTNCVGEIVGAKYCVGNIIGTTNSAVEIIKRRLDEVSNFGSGLPTLSRQEIKEILDMRACVTGISAEFVLNKRIAKLTRGWQQTFQLPIVWENDDLQFTLRNESSPPIDETVGCPSIPCPFPPYLIGSDCSQSFNR